MSARPTGRSPGRSAVLPTARRTEQRPGHASAPRTTWELPRDPIAARLARRALAAEHPDLAQDVLEVAQVLTSELVTNALKHGEGVITLSVGRDERSLTVRVGDRGSQVPAVREHDLTAMNGRGLQLVDALAVGWGTEHVGGPTGGKVVWFTLRTS